MAESEPGTGTPHYDREFLLSPGKRNQMMALWEVQKFGTDSFGDPDYVSIYGMRPAEWVASRVVWKKRNGAFFRLVKCTTSRPPCQAATGGTRHGERYQEAGRYA